MNFQLRGKVLSLIPEQRFMGKSGELVRNGFVLETMEEYPKRVAFSVLGEERWRNMSVSVGLDCIVSFDLSSREWNGRYFTEASAWRLSPVERTSEREGKNAVPESVPTPAVEPSVVPESSSQPSEEDDLPF